MKEVLFRGKRKDNGEWTEGYFFKSWDRVFLLWGMTGESPNMEEVIPETVGQFTGLTDKNGRKIFEGDVLKIIGGGFAFVLWDDRTGGYKLRVYQKGEYKRISFTIENLLLYKAEIIGNIYTTKLVLEND